MLALTTVPVILPVLFGVGEGVGVVTDKGVRLKFALVVDPAAIDTLLEDDLYPVADAVRVYDPAVTFDNVYDPFELVVVE